MLLQLLLELQEEIFSYCNVVTLKNLSCCSTLCLEACRMSLWRSVTIPFEELSNKNFASDTRIELLKHTRILNLPAPGVIESSARTILTDNCLTISKYCNPTVLNISFLPYDEFEAFVEFNKLVKCCWKKNYECSYQYQKQEELTDASLLNITKISSLTELSIDNCTKLTDTGISRFLNLQNLQILYMDDCRQITDDALSHISQIQSLTELEIQLCDNITDVGVSFITNLFKLEKLNLADCREITDDCLGRISQMESLTELNIRRCRITDVGVCLISNLFKLEKLNMAYCQKITDDSLGYISKMESLTELNIQRCSGITKRWTKTHFRNLQKLYR